LFDTEQRAIGVEYLKGERLYRAHANVSETAGRNTPDARKSRSIFFAAAHSTPRNC
jgi:hypothetical protein